MRKGFFIFCLILCALPAIGQSLIQPSDSLNKTRTIVVSSAIGSAWSGSIIGLSSVWYANVEKTKWHTFDDSKNWLQMDKVGHFYTAYQLNAFTSSLYEWSGVSKRRSTWIGAGISIGYQTTFEFLDAYSSEWGFSWSDVVANSLGTISYTTQQLIWQEERILPKFSYHPTTYSSIRPEVLGNSFAESLLKDYNGQTYWLSFSPGTFFEHSSIPKWACVSLGYSVDQKLVGDQEVYTDPLTTQTYHSSRQFLLSLDIDFSRLPIKRPWLKLLVKQFNYLKIPFPAILVQNGKLSMSPLYF